MRTTELTSVGPTNVGLSRSEAIAMHPASRPSGGERVSCPSGGERTTRSWIDRLFRLPVFTEPAVDELLPFAGASPASTDPRQPSQRVTVVGGALDDGSLEALARFMGPGLTLHTDAVEHGDIVVTAAAEQSAIDDLHAVGDTVVVTVLERRWGHDPSAVAAALDAGADACLEANAMPEVAAHLRAVARRHQRRDLHPRPPRHLGAVA